MSNTPETDLLAASNPQSTTVIWGLARTLETQRDEARAEVERLREAIESAYRILSPYKLSDTWHGHLCRNLHAALQPPIIGWRPADAPEKLPRLNE